MKLPKPLLQFLNWFPHQAFAFLACVVFIIGLLAGRAVMSIGMMMLFGNALINLSLPRTFKQFIKNRAALLLCGLFVFYALSILWSDNLGYYATRIQLMLPFLVLPFSFQSIKWERRYFDYLIMLFVVVCIAGVSWSLYHYILNKDAIDAGYGVSKSMPTPFQKDHIRFGVAVVLGISLSFQLFKHRLKERWIWLSSAIVLIAYLHLLASKTALLALYIIILYEVLTLIIRRKKWMHGIGLLAILISLPIVFYFTSSSFYNKVWYSVYSFYELSNSKAQTNVSDEGRIVSYQTALGVVKENWLLGVGLGDGKDVMTKAYADHQIQTEKILYPHNQFLYIALVLGLMGLLYFLYCGFYLFKTYFGASDWMSSFLLIWFVPFMVEAFLNTQYGIATFLFFLLLLERRETSN